MERTVNPPAKPTQVRILLPPLTGSVNPIDKVQLFYRVLTTLLTAVVLAS
jgi:hypothetical protein